VNDMAKNEQMNRLKAGVDEWNAWREENDEPIHLNSADLSGVNLVNANLIGADLRGTYLKGTSLSRARVTGADLTGAVLSGSSLKNADFSGAELLHTMLGLALCNHAKFKKANFSGANLKGTVFTGADLRGANFAGANLENAEFLDTIFDSNTVGLDNLAAAQKDGLIQVEIDDGMPCSTPTHATVGTARKIVELVHSTLNELPVANDWGDTNPEYQDLYRDLRITIAGLRLQLSDAEDENQQLSEANTSLQKAVNDAEPLLKQAWKTFVLDSAKVASKAPIFFAGVAAGMAAGSAWSALTGQPVPCTV
jgi:uncharacterized protein YjbI with pentapeptide repeats